MTTKRLFIIALLASALMLVLGITSTPIDAVYTKGATSNNASALASYFSPESIILDGAPNDFLRPAIAYDPIHSEYLVVSQYVAGASGSIYGARVNMTGYAHTFFDVSYNLYDARNPVVAFNWSNGEYLVVWEQYNASQKLWEIYGRILTWDGPSYSYQPFLIAQGSSMNLMYPKVVWNMIHNEYMVVWHTGNAANTVLMGIGRRRLGADGSFLTNPDFITQSNYPKHPVIAYNVATNQYLVVWAQTGNSTDIYGGKLSREGALQGSVFPIATAANEQQFPAITSNWLDQYLVVWQDDRLDAGDWDIYGQFLNGSGNLVGGNTWFDTSTDNETYPAVVVNHLTDEYLIVYQKTTAGGESIWGRFTNENNAILDWFELNSGSWWGNGYPAVATHLAGYFIAYEDETFVPGSTSEIHGRMWSSRAVYIPLVLK